MVIQTLPRLLCSRVYMLANYTAVELRDPLINIDLQNKSSLPLILITRLPVCDAYFPLSCHQHNVDDWSLGTSYEVLLLCICLYIYSVVFAGHWCHLNNSVIALTSGDG